MFRRRSKKKSEAAKNETKAEESTTEGECKHDKEPEEKQQPAFRRLRSLTITPKGGNSKVMAMSGKAVPLTQGSSAQGDSIKPNSSLESKDDVEQDNEIAILHFEDDLTATDERLRRDTALSLKFESSYDL